METKDRIMIAALVALFLWCGYLQATMNSEIQTLTEWGDDAAGVISRNGERAQERLDDLDDRVSRLERYH